MHVAQPTFSLRQQSSAAAPFGAAELRRLLVPLGKPQPAPRHEALCRAGTPSDMLYVIQHGWAATRGPREQGRSPILRIHLPGDIVGLGDVGLGAVPQDVVMLTEGRVHAVPRTALAMVLQQTPHLWPLLLSLSNAELVLAQNRAILFDRACAEDRLIHLLLDLRARLAVEGVGDGNRFPLPMNQQEIGEATGMTGIYVNRLMGKLVREKRIEVQRPYVRLLDRAGLEVRMGFIELAPALSLSWIGKG
ncbi:MAG: Crp/Fnr family transcriptional regulator [Pseudomonadota bacterium]|jgi:CRP/FNR family transcriptional regulator, anaerobic regulatory protein